MARSSAKPVPRPRVLAVEKVVRARLADSISATDRSYTLCVVRAELFRAALVIYQGKRRDVYALSEEANPPDECPDFRVFHLLKCSKPFPEWEPYEVIVGTIAGAGASCSCVGWGRWKECKHADALSHLVRVERLAKLD